MSSIRTLLLADGASDQPLGAHVAALAAGFGVTLNVVAPDLRRLSPGHALEDRLRCVLNFDPDFDLLVVHRDSENRLAEERVHEISRGVRAADVDWPTIPVVPVRMTEAWLLLDEREIRTVAGRPSGTRPLNLPSPRAVESLADPKATLEQALDRASGFAGRRLVKFKRDFGEHRRQLLERLDRSGPVATLEAWKGLEQAVEDVVRTLVPG